MNWKKELDEISQRKSDALKMGGEDKVNRQHARGKLDARERLKRLLDTDGFREIGQMAGKGHYDKDGNFLASSPSNFIFGRGLINNRPVVATADDFTVRGGAADAAIYRKFAQAEQMAAELQMPLIRMIDGTGGGGSVKQLIDMGLTYVPAVPGWDAVVRNLDEVPVVALALGPVAGLGAARVAASHYSVMVKEVSQLFAAGPAVVAAVGETLDKEGLGGSQIHTRNGAVDDEAESEDQAFALARKFLSYLPSSRHERAQRGATNDPVDRCDGNLLTIVPEDSKQAYNMRRIVDTLFDESSAFEIGKRWGRSAITGLARLSGWPVAFVASDPSFLGGAWTAEAAQKVKRHVELAELFHLPVIHLVDNPGFHIGLAAEQAATIRHGVDTMNAIYRSTIPWATVVIRKAYGIAGSAMSDHTRFQYRCAWPSGDWGSLPLEGGIEVAYKAQLEASDDPETLLKEIRERLDKVRSPMRTAEAFLIEDIIDPRETRPFLCEFADHAQRMLHRPS